MSEHELTVTRHDLIEDYFGECTCGWTCRRSRARDLKREHRKHSADAVKLTLEQWREREQRRKMQEKTP